MTVTKGFDSSRHNHPLTREYPGGVPFDFTVAHAGEYRIHFPRLSVGNYYTDPWFAADFDAGRAAGFIEVPYHVITPEYPDDEQIERILRSLDGRIPDGLVLDCELIRGQSAGRFTASLRYHTTATRRMVRKPELVWCYTNVSFADQYILNTFGLPLFISNPGPGNGWNPNPTPAMPDLWDVFKAWQRSFKHEIPGMPDLSMDYDEIQMSEEALLVYFGMAEEGHPGEGEMEEIRQMFDQLIANQLLMLEKLDAQPAPLDPPVDPPVDPPMPPVVDYYVRVTDAWANARFVYRYKRNGTPIFQIYPSDSSLVKDRVRFKNNVLVPVIPQRIRGDGNVYCYQIVGTKGRNNETLYIWSEECEKTWT